jgi:hypothetical protein
MAVLALLRARVSHTKSPSTLLHERRIDGREVSFRHSASPTRAMHAMMRRDLQRRSDNWC